MKSLIPALMVLALAAPSVHAQSADRHCLECDSVAASPSDMRHSGVGAIAIAPDDLGLRLLRVAGLYGSGWNSTASGSDIDSDGFASKAWKPTSGGSEPDGMNAVAMTTLPASVYTNGKLDLSKVFHWSSGLHTSDASDPGGVSAVSMPAAPANPMMKIDDARSTLGR